MNLLPEENNIFFKKYYLKRFFTILGVLVFFVIIAGTVVLTPAYLLVFSYKNDLRRGAEVHSKKDAKLADSAVVLEIKKLNNQLKLAESMGKEKKLNLVITNIIDKKNSGVKITLFSYEKGKELGSDDKISLRGRVKTREDLLLFESQLKKEWGEQRVVSPISNLINEKDFDFSVILSVKNEK